MPPKKRTRSESDSKAARAFASESADRQASRKKAKSKAKREFVDEDSPFSQGAFIPRGTEWPHHADSDESDAYDSDAPDEDRVRLYRALRPDEDPAKKGIKPFNARLKSRTLAEHVGGGGKSRYVSFTSSKRKAVKWALKERKKGEAARVATVDVPPETELAVFSFEDTPGRAELGNTASNFARSSSEVVVSGQVPKKQVVRVQRLEIDRSVKKKTLKKAAAKKESPFKSVQTRILTGADKHKFGKSGSKPQTIRFTDEFPPP
ncbi:MAG: hypothetical protein KDK30_03945 [Leptospiraceae bacterium]|nr:hypothetical protein [Leptospiraceae bacterium]MCB1315393.1 hypothetical protein [Leptospiraceae bacterium]MCB1319113.1 hypothetical protein [Leptospiraceae bacterium]